MMAFMKRTAIYARVSTTDRDQTPRTQLRELREYARHRNFKITEFVDKASGTTNGRPAYQKMLEAVKKRKFDVVLVWRYDRFARSTRELVNQLEEFQSLDVDFVSLSEGTDTTTPQGKLVFTIMAGLAEFESALIGERVRAGMARARDEGKLISRPRIESGIAKRIKKLRKEGMTIRAISEEVGVSVGTVANYS
jgi:DNA invertase Pin-like site-specific DNA recombinase